MTPLLPSSCVLDVWYDAQTISTRAKASCGWLGQVAATYEPFLPPTEELVGMARLLHNDWHLEDDLDDWAE